MNGKEHKYKSYASDIMRSIYFFKVLAVFYFISIFTDSQSCNIQTERHDYCNRYFIDTNEYQLLEGTITQNVSLREEGYNTVRGRNYKGVNFGQMLMARKCAVYTKSKGSRRIR